MGCVKWKLQDYQTNEGTCLRSSSNKTMLTKFYDSCSKFEKTFDYQQRISRPKRRLIARKQQNLESYGFCSQCVNALPLTQVKGIYSCQKFLGTFMHDDWCSACFSKGEKIKCVE